MSERSYRIPVAVMVAVLFVMTSTILLFSTSICHGWTEIKGLPRMMQLDCVSATDMDHIWVGSGAGADTGGVYFYDGSSWSRQDTMLTREIDALDNDNVWAVGLQNGDEGSIIYYDGSSWTHQQPDASIIEEYDWWILNGVSAADDTHVWAVAEIDPSDSEEDEYAIEFFDGNSWQIQTNGTGFALNDVCALDSNHVWAVGDNGAILYYDGNSWTAQSSGTNENLNCVTAIDENHVWVGGGHGISGGSVILFWDGTDWTSQGQIYYDTTDPLEVYGIAALDQDHVYAVSSFCTVAVFDGITWSETRPGDIHPLFDVCTVQDKYVIAVGGVGFDVGIIVDNPGEYTYYFAEGTTREGFEEWLCLQNPGSEAIDVNATYMLFGGEPVSKTYIVPATSRVSVNVNDEVGPGQDVAVRLASESEFYAERPLYFNYKRDVQGYGWTGGHCVTGYRQTSQDWYFAEGTTREGFEEWICIQNPNSFEVEVIVDYIFAGAYTQQKRYVIGEESRTSVFVNGDVGAGQDVSLHVHSDNLIVAERPIYFDYHGAWTGGHCIMGTPSPGTQWYFAEGTTRPGYDEYVAVQNANDVDANLTLHFLKPDGTETVGNEVVRANSRWTLDVNDKLGTGVDSSLAVESDQPIVAERPIYFNYRNSWDGGHDVAGATALKTRWFFAEGCTLANFDEYICIGNPGLESAQVNLEFMLEDGQVIPHSLEVGPKSRATVSVWSIVGRGHDVSTELTSNNPVVAERPMYFDYEGAMTGGHDVVGF